MPSLSMKTPFGFFAIINLVALPLHISIVVRDYILKYPDKVIYLHLGLAVFVSVLYLISIAFYTREIGIMTGEYVHRGRRVQVTEGDKMVLNLIRRPYAFLIQVIIALFNGFAIIEIFGLK